MIRDRSIDIGSGIKISNNLGIRDQNFKKSWDQGSKFQKNQEKTEQNLEKNERKRTKNKKQTR